MAIVQFGEKQDLAWTKEVQPRGSRIIAYIQGVDMFEPTRPAYTAVFQDLKNPRKLTMFETVYGKEPEEHTYDTPIIALKHRIERSYKKTIFLAPQDEVLSLISDSSIAQEKAEKDREIARLQLKLERMYDSIEDIERWEKYKKITGAQAQLEMISILGEIVSSCSSIIINITHDMRNAPTKTLPAWAEFNYLPGWMRDAIGQEAKKHGREWKAEALEMLGDILRDRKPQVEKKSARGQT